MGFRCHFSDHADPYAQHLPGYPARLFQELAARTESHERAWDFGTGNRQAAVTLVEHLDDVFATDASQEQLEQPEQHDRIPYRVEPAEETSSRTGSIDLTTVGTAVH